MPVGRGGGGAYLRAGPWGHIKSLNYPVLDQYGKHVEGGGAGIEPGDATPGRTTKPLGRRPCGGSSCGMGGGGGMR